MKRKTKVVSEFGRDPVARGSSAKAPSSPRAHKHSITLLYNQIQEHMQFKHATMVTMNIALFLLTAVVTTSALDAGSTVRCPCLFSLALLVRVPTLDLRVFYLRITVILSFPVSIFPTDQFCEDTTVSLILSALVPPVTLFNSHTSYPTFHLPPSLVPRATDAHWTWRAK